MDGEGVRFLLSFPFFSFLYPIFSEVLSHFEETSFGDVHFLSGPSVAREPENTQIETATSDASHQIPP